MRHDPVVLAQKKGAGWLALGGYRLEQVLSEELFRDEAGMNEQSTWVHLASCCHDRWVDLANAVAALPQPLEGFLVLGARPGKGHANVSLDVLLAGRGKTRKEAETRCLAAAVTAEGLLATTLDYASFGPIAGAKELQGALRHLEAKHRGEARRRLEKVTVSHGRIKREPFGFRTAAQQQAVETPRRGDAGLLHLFPWVPSDDSWRRLGDMLGRDEKRLGALVVHFRGFDRSPIPCTNSGRTILAAAERMVRLDSEELKQSDTVLSLQVQALRHEAFRRLCILEGRTIAGRVFITSDRRLTDSLVATVLNCIDDASIRPGQPGAESIFRGGAEVKNVPSGELLAPLDEPTFDILFSPVEAPAILRTPMPTDVDFPGVSVNRARTASCVGSTGTDVPLGINLHRGISRPVALAEPDRFRHTYMVGQTGTGKSTLMLHQILHDINANRGVAVLDPHGSLIDEILLRYPMRRADDLVLVDVTDVERPVGFNVLRLKETEPFKYRLARDLIIDDIYNYMDRTYDMKATGGPIFETHLRGMLALLMGFEPPPEDLIPNLMIFRTLYTNRHMRKTLTRMHEGKDASLDDFIKEAQAAGGEASIRNLGPYISSKFSRFISDTILRNITCQKSILDLEEIVDSGKVLLFYLGKGQFGEAPAGLLASQLVSRIWTAVTGRGAGKGSPFFLYADEFQLFADERFAEMLAEARKFGLSLTVAHQYADQIPARILRAIMGNVGTTIALRVGARDGEFFEPLFRPTFSRRDLSSLPNFRAYVRGQGILGQEPFSVEIPRPPGGTNKRNARQLRNLSRKKYGRPRKEVEKEIDAIYRAYADSD